jgi:DNA-binding transcriptional ArsR family regulator
MTARGTRVFGVDPARVTDVAAPFAMSLNAVSKHVKVLERAGVVRRVKEGREHTLSLRAGPLENVARWVHRYEGFWSQRLDRLESFFASKSRDANKDRKSELRTRKDKKS